VRKVQTVRNVLCVQMVNTLFTLVVGTMNQSGINGILNVQSVVFVRIVNLLRNLVVYIQIKNNLEQTIQNVSHVRQKNKTNTFQSHVKLENQINKEKIHNSKPVKNVNLENIYQGHVKELKIHSVLSVVAVTMANKSQLDVIMIVKMILNAQTAANAHPDNGRKKAALEMMTSLKMAKTPPAGTAPLLNKDSS